MDDRITCLACGEPIDDDAPTYPDVSGTLCEACSPTFAALINEAEADYFVDLEDGRPIPQWKRHEIYNAHIAAGGKPSDSMARRS